MANGQMQGHSDTGKAAPARAGSKPAPAAEGARTARPPEADEDHALAMAAKNGDISAFEALVERYERRIYAVAFRMLADQEDARDAAQDAFLRVFRALPGFQGESKFSTWIYRIVSNLCVDKLRKRRDEAAFSLDAPFADDDGPGDGVIAELPDTAIGVAAEAENAEFRELVHRAVSMLPDAHRAIIVMRDIEDLSYPEIAEILGCPPGTVKSRINRARAKLREAMCGMRELEGYLSVKR